MDAVEALECPSSPVAVVEPVQAELMGPSLGHGCPRCAELEMELFIAQLEAGCSASPAPVVQPVGAEPAVAALGLVDCACCTGLQVELNIARADTGYWRAMHRKALEREKKLQEQLEELQAKLRLRERQLFGRKSEKGKGSKGRGYQDPRGQKGRGGKRGQQPGAPGHGRRRHENLPAVEETVELAAEDQQCPGCHLPFAPFPGTEDSEQVEIEVKAHRRIIRRKRYRPTCNCPQLPGIITAPAPAKLIPKGAYGLSFWVQVLLDKYLFQRPTYRLLSVFRLTYDLEISQGSVTGGLKRLAPLFEPLYQGIIEQNLDASHWHADETRWEVYEELEGKQGHRWYLWVFCSATTVVFKLDPSRSASVLMEHFGQEAEGIISADRYSAYKVLLKDGRLLIAFCWAHVRRDFLGVALDWPKLESWALAWVDRINELFRLNKQRVSVPDEPKLFAEADIKVREAARELSAQLEVERADSKLHPASEKVLRSLHNHWSGLVLFVEHPEVPMDNNTAERQLRNPAVGRKNYYGSGAVWSGLLAAMLFSLFQTLLLDNINPRLWLGAYLQVCAENGGKVPDNATQWLPWNLGEEQRSRFQIAGRSDNDTS